MAVKAITTTFQVSFSTGEEGEGILVAEVDDREEGLNNGDTQFAPGDPVYFLVFTSDNVTVVAIETSLGNVQKVGGVVKEVEEFYSFDKPDNMEQSLNYPYSGNGSLTWIGKTMGNAVFAGNTIKVTSNSGNKYAAGVLKSKFSSNGTAYKLTHTPLPGLNEYEIHILVVGEVREEGV